MAGTIGARTKTGQRTPLVIACLIRRGVSIRLGLMTEAMSRMVEVRGVLQHL